MQIILNDMPICRTDLENCLPSDEYGVKTGRTDLELDAFGVLGEECNESGGGL